MKSKLLLLPGMMCDKRLFASLIHRFQSDFEIETADITLDQSIQAIAQRILTKYEEDFHLAGLSMGGIVAMEILRQAPQRVLSSILLDTNARKDAPQNTPIREAQMKAVLRGELAQVMQNELKPRYIFEPKGKETILKTCMDMALDLGANAFINQSIALKNRPSQLENLNKIKCPTLILCGENDALCPVEYHQEIFNAIPNACFQTIENCGHLPTLEQPDITNKMIANFFEQETKL